MAVDYNWLFSYYNPCGGTCGSATGNICTGRVYTTVLNRDNEAIDFDASPKVFDVYDASDDRFRKFLTTHAERSRYWYGLVNCSELDIADNPFGEDYAIEYWCECISGTPDREADKLVKVDRVVWAADRVHESRLDISREQNIAALAGLATFTQQKSSSDSVSGSWGEYFANADNFCCDTTEAIFSGFTGGNIGECFNSICDKIGNWPENIAETNYVCHAAFSYDTVTQFVNAACWLEKDGDLQLEPLSYQLQMIDSDGNVIFNVSGDQTDLQVGFGVFFTQIANIDLVPDETYFAMITINDEDDNPHVSGVGPVAWD